MKIETKLEINDLVVHKYQTPSREGFTAFEILEITSQTCYGGTQWFITTRPIAFHKEYKKKYEQDGEYNYIIGCALETNDQPRYSKFREDEVVLIDKKYKALLPNK